MNLDDQQTIDALCRLNIGWSGSVPGDVEDYQAAVKIITERANRVKGHFRKPTELERYRSALESIARNTCCDRCQEAARVASGALTPQIGTEK